MAIVTESRHGSGYQQDKHKTATYCESIGLKVGDKIRVLADNFQGAPIGSILTLSRDDGTNAPMFLIDANHSVYFLLTFPRAGGGMCWERVTDYKAINPFVSVVLDSPIRPMSSRTSLDDDTINPIQPRKTAHELQDEEVGIPAPLDDVIDTSPEHVEIAEENRHMQPSTAQGFLEAALETLNQRGKDYDKPAGERSAASVATAFNAITGRNVTEQEVWLILQLVKDVRQWQQPDRYHADSALDCVAYAALKAEALVRGEFK